MGRAHLELGAGGVGALPVAGGTAHLELSASGAGDLVLSAGPPGAARLGGSGTLTAMPSLTQSATGTFAPPRPADRPGVGSYALTMAAVIAGSGAVAAYGANHDTAGSLEALFALLVVLRSLPRD